MHFYFIDDGSTDKTVEVARNLGVHHILRFTNNKGLAKAFISGINESLKLNADIINGLILLQKTSFFLFIR